MNNVVPLAYERNVAPAADAQVLEDAVRAAIEQFGAEAFAQALVELAPEQVLKAA